MAIEDNTQHPQNSQSDADLTGNTITVEGVRYPERLRATWADDSDYTEEELAANYAVRENIYEFYYVDASGKEHVVMTIAECA